MTYTVLTYYQANLNHHFNLALSQKLFDVSKPISSQLLHYKFYDEYPEILLAPLIVSKAFMSDLLPYFTSILQTRYYR